MHHIYRTEAIILSSRPSGESGKYLTVLSKEYGVLKIEAQAVRKNDSKLRQSIQDFSVVDISFVRGKTGNKLVNASFISNFYYEISNQKILKSISNIFRLVEKMIVDEEKDDSIFDLFIKINLILKDNLDCTDDFLKALEIISVYRILSSLGYLSRDGEYNFILSEELDEGLVLRMEKKLITDKEKIIRLINNAINESHL